MELIKGKPSSWVTLDYVRDGKVKKVKVQRDAEANMRVWRVLSEYSYAHPEDFDDEEDGDGGGEEKQDGGKPTGAVEALKRQLLERNQDVDMLKNNMEEAERARTGLLMRINELLARAQEESLAKAETAAVVRTHIRVAYPSQAASPKLDWNCAGKRWLYRCRGCFVLNQSDAASRPEDRLSCSPDFFKLGRLTELTNETESCLCMTTDADSTSAAAISRLCRNQNGCALWLSARMFLFAFHCFPLFSRLSARFFLVF